MTVVRKLQGIGIIIPACVLGLSPRAVAQTPFDLGAAGPQNFAVLNLGGNLNMSNPNGGVLGSTGNVGFAGSGNVSDSSGLSSGELIITSSAVNNVSISGSPGGFAGGIVTNNTLINQAVSDAQKASGEASALSTTAGAQNLGNINNQNLTITGHSGLNVVNVSGITLNGQTITLSAPSNGFFVINDTGSLQVNNTGGIVLSGGLTTDNVLYNVTGGDVHFTGGGNKTQASGIFLDTSGNVALSPGLVNGELIGNNIQIVSGAQVVNNCCASPPPPPGVPEPGNVVMLASGLTGFGLFRRRFGRRQS